MALVTRTLMKKKPASNAVTSDKQLPSRKKAPRAVAPVELPRTKSIISHDLSEYGIMIHGIPGIGKTTLAMQEDPTLLLTCDPPQKSMSIFQRHIGDWATSEAYLDALEQAAKSGDYPYKRVVIDGVDLWHAGMQAWVEAELGVSAIEDAGFSKGWQRLTKEFKIAITRFRSLPGGCWFISHSKWKEVETRRKGVKVEKLVPTLIPSATDVITGNMDVVGAYIFNEEQRVLVVKPDERTNAKNRIQGHFLTPKGEQVEEIPMGNSAKEAWQNFLRAFNNQQEFIKPTGNKPSLVKKTISLPGMTNGGVRKPGSLLRR